jgi:uncharacterized protein YjbI with pentapeptide repeats
MSRILIFASSCLFSLSAYAVDLGFRYVDGVCQNADDEQGYNVNYLGQCGDLQGVTLFRFNLDCYDLSGSLFNKVNFTQSSFEGADLTGVQLVDADITAVNFKYTNLRDANLTGTTYQDAVFSGATYDKGTVLPFTDKEAEAMGMIYIVED